MALVILTLQDEEDGQITLGYTTEPVIQSETQELTDAQVMGMMAVHNIVLALNEGQDGLDLKDAD